MSYPLVRDLAAEGIPVRLTCGALRFSAQAGYEWRAWPCSDRDCRRPCHQRQRRRVRRRPTFGYRIIADELERAGHRSGEQRVWRLCRQQRIWSTTTKKGRRSCGKTPGPRVHDDLVQPVFTAPAPDMVWLTDITEHPTAQRRVYCCSTKDCFSNRIVG
jgi:putative transposase